MFKENNKCIQRIFFSIRPYMARPLISNLSRRDGLANRDFYGASGGTGPRSNYDIRVVFVRQMDWHTLIIIFKVTDTIPLHVYNTIAKAEKS